MTRSLHTVALLSNPTAGRGRGARYREIALAGLRAAGLQVHDLVGSDAATATALARASCAQHPDALVVCGGDGMVHLAAQVLAGTSIPLGLIPAGTGNDVARWLGLSRRDPAAVQRVLTGRRRRIDLAQVGETSVVTVVAAGFDAVVNERAERMPRPRGQLRYTLATVAELGTFRPVHYRLELDGRTWETPAMLVAVGNLPSYGGGLRIAEGAVPDDGLLDVVVIGPMSRAGLVRTYPRLFRGTHVDHPRYTRHRVRRVSIQAPGITAYGDGERIAPLPLTIECSPGALEVLA